MSAMFRIPLPTGNWVRLLLAPALIFVSSAMDRGYQTDLWHHLARGRAISEDGHMVDNDRFTYTVANSHFQDSNWLWQVAFFKVHTLGGLDLDWADRGRECLARANRRLRAAAARDG